MVFTLYWEELYNRHYTTVPIELHILYEYKYIL